MVKICSIVTLEIIFQYIKKLKKNKNSIWIQFRFKTNL